MLHSTSGLAALILAAGEGTRMRSSLPKTLHPLCGRPMIRYPIELARRLGADRVVVVIGRGADQLRQALQGEPIEYVTQHERRGTGHAVDQARALLAAHTGPVLILYGDMPLLEHATLAGLLDHHQQSAADLSLLTAVMPDAGHYGRIVRDAQGRIERIAEFAAASPEQRAIREMNPGVYVAQGTALFEWIAALTPSAANGEYFLTDIVERALAAGRRVETASMEDWTEAAGINSRVDLAQAEAILRRRINQRWMLEGVTFENPELIRVDVDVRIGRDSVLAAGVALRGRTRLGERCRIAEGSVLEDCELEDDVWVKPHCALEEARLAAHVVVGPSAHLRPGARLEAGARVGNFVEIKNSTLGARTKADHLSYIGDADLGSGITIGCGAITVNYDGFKKTRTTIGDDAFVGCNSNLIAPVAIEPGAYVAAGSTITQPVPAGALGVARARQRNIAGWRARKTGKTEKQG